MTEPEAWALLEHISGDLATVRAELSAIAEQLKTMRDDRAREPAPPEPVSAGALRDPDVRAWLWRLATLAAGTAVVIAGIAAGIVQALPDGALGVFGS